MITTEQAFEILPHVIAIIEKLDVQAKATSVGEKFAKKYPDKKPSEYMNEAGVAVIVAVSKELPKVKDEVFEVIAVVQGCTVEEARKQRFTKSIKVFKEIFQDQELMDFFTEAVS